MSELSAGKARLQGWVEREVWPLEDSSRGATRRLQDADSKPAADEERRRTAGQVRTVRKTKQASQKRREGGEKSRERSHSAFED